MPHLIGPDFVGIQTPDLDAARSFYTEVVGLTPAAHSPPGAVVFDTRPIPFAIRMPVVELTNTDRLGEGIALWFGCDDADALHAHLADHGTEIAFAPKDGPFGRYFAFRDPFGYTITAHNVTHA
ncbi:VOC family protein [Xanthomonas vesicatoria]|uniref:Lactoylglutathione lyase family protein n=1 Tax=Xanthomonas vesicatoria ATCC 35937 TaxID=925775 RepID=F0B818_9XANT|nr:VOC family protein [Xanthomonas vesicatoria]APP77246.1 glyoxalase [Xanthomonas vesicatoria ATCC 35937]EGD11404.1 lactoylglutathione lyase family protein [Xanthomonas vesicatoria ATCC 35937]KTF35474.1 glyoxalase [Xanthomonas vesicatoria]KTF37571.1 glyoxalase [Xanthomonas vesicatoria]MCC8560504.1 VOC family protein [Xanthomonas vesicatoria]